MAVPFIDSFDGAGAATNLSSWTPTGGTAWTLASGASNSVRVELAGYITSRSTTASVHTCDDQGTDDHYAQARMGALAASIADVCVRLVDYDNRVGWRTSGTGATGSELRKRVGGTNTALITRQGVSNEHLRIEADGADGALKIRWYEGGTGSSPGTWNLLGSEQTIADTVFNGETSTGLASGTSSANAWIQSFQSGPLSAGGNTLVVTQGAYSLSGQSVGLQAGRKLAVTQGTYALTGQSVTLTKASAGGLTVTQGSYTLNGQSVNLRAARKLYVTQGAYALAGQNVTLTKGAAGTTLNVTQGAYALTGRTVNLRTARKLYVNYGLYTLTGRAVGFSGGTPLLWTPAAPAGGLWTPAVAAAGAWTPQ